MNALRRACLLIAVMLFSGSTLAADNESAPYVQRQKDRANIVVKGGEVHDGAIRVALSGTLQVVLSVEGGNGLEVEPIGKLTPSSGWEVRSPATAPTTIPLSDQRTRWQQVFFVEPLKPGDNPLPLAPLHYRERAEAKWETIAWDTVPVQVTTEVGTADLKELRDIRPPEQPPAPPPWPSWPFAVGLAAVLLLAAVTSRRWWRRRVPQPVPPTPAQRALAELNRLEALGLPGHGEVNRFHTLLADTVRQYLERRFQLRAPHQTTEEFLAAVQAVPELTAEHRDLLRDLFRRCDLAKFARAAATPEECQVTAALARSFVEQTAAPVPAQDRPG